MSALASTDQSALFISSRTRDVIFKLLGIARTQPTSTHDDEVEVEVESETTLGPEIVVANNDSSSRTDLQLIKDAIDSGDVAADVLQERPLQHLLLDAVLTSQVATDVAGMFGDDMGSVDSVLGVFVSTESGLTRVFPASLASSVSIFSEGVDSSFYRRAMLHDGDWVFSNLHVDVTHLENASSVVLATKSVQMTVSDSIVSPAGATVDDVFIDFNDLRLLNAAVVAVVSCF